MPSQEQTLVMKFGGTSVGTIKAMSQAVQITMETSQTWPKMVVVVSALSGVTDVLIESARAAASGDHDTFTHSAHTLQNRHIELVKGLVANPERQTQVIHEIKHLIGDFTNLCQSIGVLGEASPRALDAVASLGERLCVRIFAAALESAGGSAKYVESTRLILTDDRFQNAAPDMEATRVRTCQVLKPLLESGMTAVVTGFIGATPQGVTTTLGRGGSDYSASILALALRAAEVWIWTDVDGVMTADPRLVPEAHTIPVLSYREVAEMAYFGAKVLHPKSIHPVIEAGISLRVCNTFNPHGPGTRLVADHDTNGHGKIKAIATIRGFQLVTLSGRGMLGVPGVAGRIFSAAATTGISIPLIVESTSEQSICFAAPKESIPAVLKALRSNLSLDFQRGDIDQATASEDVDIITVVCPGIRKTIGIAGRIFGILGEAGINVVAISYGSSDYSINFVVAAQDTPLVMRSLHQLVDKPENLL
jgi:bifunctional aspartokinase / homoserine dehydrogenase 1